MEQGQGERQGERETERGTERGWGVIGNVRQRDFGIGPSRYLTLMGACSVTLLGTYQP